jgi:hydrogenase maturation protease
MSETNILVLGVGCILYRDEGFGVRVVQRMLEEYAFDENITVMDGGTLGLNLLGVIKEADHLIVVDAIRNRGKAGDLYRLSGEDIPARVRAKNSLHQVDFLEALTMCQVFDKVPETVIVGVEPEDIETLDLELSPVIREKVEPVIDMVLAELNRLKAGYRKKEPEEKGEAPDVCCHTIKDHKN